MAFTESQSKTLRALLPHNVIGLVSKELKGKYSREMVRLVLHGKRSNEVIQNTIIALAEKLKRDAEEMENRIKNLAQ